MLRRRLAVQAPCQSEQMDPKVIVDVKQTTESTAQSIREWAIAVGTVGATVVAVYVGVLREWRRRPRLSLEYGGQRTGDAVVVLIGPLRGQAAYVRLRVAAATRRSAAEDVEVMILAAREIEPREGYPPNPDPIAIDGQLLVWSNTNATRLTIPPVTY